MSEGQQLKNYLKEQRITNAELARMVKTSAQNVGYHLKRDKIDDSFKYKLREAGVNIFDKDKGADNSLTPVIKKNDTDHKTKSSDKKLNASTVGAFDTSNLMYVPFINQYAYAGYLSGYGDPEFMDTLTKIPFIVDKEYKGNYICLEVKGDSMDDGTKDSYSQGDHVLLREIGRDHWRDKLHMKEWDFVIAHDESMVLKKIIHHDTVKGVITCHSLNSMYPDFKLSLNEVSHIFNVIKHVKNK